MDIGSRNSYPAGKLSNFTRFEFEVDGIKCNSMEGFLQSLKFENEETQRLMCMLVGFSAKKKGSKRNKRRKSLQTLWWKGIAYPRKSKEYQYLLNKAYNCLYTQNNYFKKCLEASGKSIFTHSIGNNKVTETVLTESEFCKRLQHLKDIGLLKEKKNA